MPSKDFRRWALKTTTGKKDVQDNPLFHSPSFRIGVDIQILRERYWTPPN